MTEEDERQFEEASACHICGEQFDEEGKVRDHDHLTSKYRGAAHPRAISISSASIYSGYIPQLEGIWW